MPVDNRQRIDNILSDGGDLAAVLVRVMEMSRGDGGCCQSGSSVIRIPVVLNHNPDSGETTVESIGNPIVIGETKVTRQEDQFKTRNRFIQGSLF